MNSTDQGVVWFGATSFNASASWFVCLSCNVLLLFSSSRGTWSEERLLDFGAQGILLLTQDGPGHKLSGSETERGIKRKGVLFVFVYWSLPRTRKQQRPDSTRAEELQLSASLLHGGRRRRFGHGV